MSHLLTELHGSALKVIFDAAFIDARVDDDGDCVVQDDNTLCTNRAPRINASVGRTAGVRLLARRSRAWERWSAD